MLTAMVVVNSACLAGVAALWVWWRLCSAPADEATHFAAILEAARRFERSRPGADGEAAC